jgi:hypothetical protein
MIETANITTDSVQLPYDRNRCHNNCLPDNNDHTIEDIKESQVMYLLTLIFY